MSSKTWFATLWVTVILFATALIGLNLFLGDLNQDEGWYLYAARQVRAGKMPYRDFAYTQAPLMPYIYAAVDPLIQKKGLAGGRFFTAILGVLSVAGAGLLAARLTARRGSGHAAALLCIGLALVNAYQTYYLTVVKTYSLCSFFLVAGFLTLTFIKEKRSVFLPFLAGACFMAAAGTRLSFGIAVPLITLFFMFYFRTAGRLTWFWFGLGAFLAAIPVFGVFLWAAPDNFRFFVMQYHTLRHVSGTLSALIYKAGFISRLVQAYFVPAILLISLATLSAMLSGTRLKALQAGDNIKAEEYSILPMIRKLLWLVIGAATLVHFLAPFPYDDYQVPVYTIFTAALASAITRLAAGNARILKYVSTAIITACVAAAFSSPINQDWFIRGRDRIWWRLKDKPALVKLQETAEHIRFLAESPDSDLLLTQDPYLAVETGMKLPAGLEMGQFSYFPSLSSEQALRLNVLNKPLFEDLLKTCDAPIAALSGYSFAMESPEIRPLPEQDEKAFWNIIESRYRLVEETPYFGQAHTTLKIFKQQEAGSGH